MSLDIFDNLLNFTQPEIDDLPIDALLKAMQQEMQPTTRYTTPLYEYPLQTKDSPKLAPAPVVSGDTLEGYAAWWYEKDGSPYIDGYADWVCPGSWAESVQMLKEQRRRTDSEFLIPHLWQHQKGDQIGGVRELYEDNKGVIYVTKLAMKIKRAQEAYDLAKIGAIGTSYAYDRLEEERLVHPVTKRGYKKLKKLCPHEISSVTFPANPYTYGRTQAKSAPRFYVPSSFQSAPRFQQKRGGLEYKHTLRDVHMKDVIASIERLADRARKG